MVEHTIFTANTASPSNANLSVPGLARPKSKELKNLFRILRTMSVDAKRQNPQLTFPSTWLWKQLLTKYCRTIASDNWRMSLHWFLNQLLVSYDPERSSVTATFPLEKITVKDLRTACHALIEQLEGYAITH